LADRLKIFSEDKLKGDNFFKNTKQHFFMPTSPKYAKQHFLMTTLRKANFQGFGIKMPNLATLPIAVT